MISAAAMMLLLDRDFCLHKGVSFKLWIYCIVGMLNGTQFVHNAPLAWIELREGKYSWQAIKAQLLLCGVDGVLSVVNCISSTMFNAS